MAFALRHIRAVEPATMGNHLQAQHAGNRLKVDQIDIATNDGGQPFAFMMGVGPW